MIIEIPDENSIIKWKYKDTDDWTIAEVSDLIKAYEERRPKGEWIDEGIYADGHNEHAYICSKCGFQIIENKNSLLENRFCKNCGADMRKGSTESRDYQRAVEDAEYCERYEPAYNPNDGSM